MSWAILLYVALPILLIIGIYRLLARITSRSSRHGIVAPGEDERKRARVFHDD